MEIVLANNSKEDLQRLSELAKAIWTEHYTDIIGLEQVEYMIRTLQSPAAMEGQMADEGYQYYFLRSDGADVGYTAIKPEEDRLFLSKLYVDRSFRHRGFASETIGFLVDACRKNGWKSIWLTVNRHNAGSIAAYQRLGFVKTREQVSDIGEGYVMDDYIMEKQIQ